MDQPTVPAFVDPPDCREDLVIKAAKSAFRSDFDWINEKEAIRVSNDGANRGLTAVDIRELARDWITGGGLIKCVKETREPYNKTRHRHYDIIIKPLAEFPRGLYVYMQIDSGLEENDPIVHL